MKESAENYLKGIYALSSKYPEGVTTNALAEKMQTKASSTTDMLQKLSEKGLVKYKPYYGSNLTAKGKRAALDIVRRHRLWEVFLVDKLGFNWDEVHEIAEQLEHVVSDDLITRLDEYLGSPRFDPHGDPIPDKKGNIIDHRNAKSMASFTKGDKLEVVGVNESSAPFLQYLEGQDLRLGNKIEILAVFDYDQSMRVKVFKKEIMLSKQVCENLLATKINRS
jgi:DtxR family transcriptional regulator, Mn-dependent transcriptional regulator